VAEGAMIESSRLDAGKSGKQDRGALEKSSACSATDRYRNLEPWVMSWLHLSSSGGYSKLSKKALKT
jgi:hypothetical protein